MATPSQPGRASAAAAQASESNQQGPSVSIQFEQGSSQAGASTGDVPKKRKHRGGKKRRARRQSFAAPSETGTDMLDVEAEPRSPMVSPGHTAPRSSFFNLARAAKSSTSLDSETLLDHRSQTPLGTRHQSIQQAPLAGRTRTSSHRQSRTQASRALTSSRSRLSRPQRFSDEDAEEYDDADDRTPLMSSAQRDRPTSGGRGTAYGGFTGPATGERFEDRLRRPSTASSRSSRRKMPAYDRQQSSDKLGSYDVNNPPSRPTSPQRSDGGYDDVMLSASPDHKRSAGNRDAIIEIDEDIDVNRFGESNSAPPSPREGPGGLLRHGSGNDPEDDVCFPREIHTPDYGHQENGGADRPRRRRNREWPDLSILEEWSAEEKEGRAIEGLRSRKVSEPLMVEGRLRPVKTAWHREADDAPYRFTYFNQEFQNTIHSQTISELVQEGQTFRDLFIPDPPELSDESSDEDDYHSSRLGVHDSRDRNDLTPSNGNSGIHSTRQSSIVSERKQPASEEATGHNTPAQPETPKQKAKRYGSRPIFWLDVLSPTDAEMKTLARAFGIHALTAEDIMMQEPREKVELFRNYYFVNYRTFEQDTNSEDYMEPVDLYVVVFREGVLSFHFSMTPHPNNVRRRIRQLSDYLSITSDWISYAIIDDITDVYFPIVQRIEDEVDDIDESVLLLLAPESESDSSKAAKSGRDTDNEKQSNVGGNASEENGGDGGDMLRRVGECRKKVMRLYRLLGNKADVIKGFAKRCNEQWEVAPKSEIGLYLGDIQDHIITMTGNLSHYEKLLSRAHSNYLAQINIRMNERAEETNDVLGKLTVLGTIVLPMNIVTGMWGMNVKVPGQDHEGLAWFWSITAGLFGFGLFCYLVMKKVYGIV